MEFSRFLKCKKGFIFRRTRGGHVERGTRADVTRHARPRGRAARAHAACRCTQVARTGGVGHASPRRRPGGATWQGAGK